MPGQPQMFPVQGYPMPQQQGDLQQQQQAVPAMGQLPSLTPGQMGHPVQAPTSQMGQPGQPALIVSSDILEYFLENIRPLSSQLGKLVSCGVSNNCSAAPL